MGSVPENACLAKRATTKIQKNSINRCGDYLIPQHY